MPSPQNYPKTYKILTKNSSLPKGVMPETLTKNAYDLIWKNVEVWKNKKFRSGMKKNNEKKIKKLRKNMKKIKSPGGKIPSPPLKIKWSLPKQLL